MREREGQNDRVLGLSNHPEEGVASERREREECGRNKLMSGAEPVSEFS